MGRCESLTLPRPERTTARKLSAQQSEMQHQTAQRTGSPAGRQAAAHLDGQHAAGPSIEPGHRRGGADCSGRLRATARQARWCRAARARKRQERLAAVKQILNLTKQPAAVRQPSHSTHSSAQSTLLHSQPAVGSQICSSSGSSGWGGERSCQPCFRSSRRLPVS